MDTSHFRQVEITVVFVHNAKFIAKRYPIVLPIFAELFNALREKNNLQLANYAEIASQLHVIKLR